MKKTWQILKQAMNKQNDKSNFPKTFLIDGKQQSNEFHIAEAFNKFYSSIGKSTSEKVPESNKNFTDYLRNPQLNSMFMETIDEYQVLEIVNKLKPKMSSGHDDIPTKIVKQSILNILAPLTHVINRSLLTGIIPKDLKLAKVIPIYKSSSREELKNYRPVSLLPAFSKILEKFVFNKITSYMNNTNLFYEHQYGFRAGHSTIHPIIDLLNTCSIAGNHTPKQLTASILCDLSKAFDVINHDILIRKLDNYGIRGIVKDWLINYLKDRQQFVEFGNAKSRYCQIECGVPQGSILGPLLYLIYVNDIGNCVSTESHILSFADDTTLVMSDANPLTLFQNVNIEVAKLYSWFCANRLSLNPHKTKYIIIKAPTMRCDLSGFDISIDGTPLSRVGIGLKEESTKFLGVYLDESLKWNNHIKYTNQKISRSLFAIKQLKHFLPSSSLKTLYFALIHPHINYGMLAWGNANQSSLNKTNILQKRALRTICKANFNSHTEPLFRKLNILKLKDQYEYETMLFMNKYIRNKLPDSFKNTFRYNYEIQGNRSTRQSNLMHIDRFNSNFVCKLPMFEFPKTWNKWCQHFGTSFISHYQIKKKVKSVMLENYAINVICNNPRCRDCNNF